MTMFYVLESACSQIPCPVFSIAHIVEQAIKFGVPVVLIVLGMLDFAKATMANDESDMAKAKQVFIKRLLSAISVFFVVAALELFFGIMKASSDNVKDGVNGANIWTCVGQIFDGSQDSCDNTEFDNPEVDGVTNPETDTEN